MVTGQINSEKIYENENFFSVFDAAPQVEGHALVISKKHFKNSLDLPNTLCPELMDAIKKTALKLIDKYKADGFNVINNNFASAGQIVNHIHFHILPRKTGDGYSIFVKKKK